MACAIGVAGEDGALRAGGAHGVPDEFRRVSLLGTLRIIDMPDGEIVLGGRVAVIPDAKRRWLDVVARPPRDALCSHSTGAGGACAVVVG